MCRFLFNLLNIFISTVAKYPLPIYTSDVLEAENAVLAADLAPGIDTEVSPLAKYGVLPVSAFGVNSV